MITTLGGLMKVWQIVIKSNWLCPFKKHGVQGVYCAHEDRKNNHIGCEFDLCPIKQPPNKADSVCACKWCGNAKKLSAFWNYCPICGQELSQD